MPATLPNVVPVERRRSQRIHLQLPMFARGLSASGAEFFELTKTLDLSANGALLLISQALLPAQLLFLTIPVPPSPTARFPAETPPIAARIRRQESANGAHLIAVEFVHPLE